LYPKKKSTRNNTRHEEKARAPTSWDKVAGWYDGWVGEEGSEFHREVAIPAVMRLLEPTEGEKVLDIGSGQGVLAPYISGEGAAYTGVDASPKLVQVAKRRHSKCGRFLLGDARCLCEIPGLRPGSFDAAVFMLSIQDMDPLDQVIKSTAWALREGGRLVIFLTHPAFGVPRQSGWGWDEGRKLQYRRVDRYLTPMSVPMKALPGHPRPATRSFHRPVSEYINTLSRCGLLVEHMVEVPSHKVNAYGPVDKAADTARKEIPLFLGLRARKVGGDQ
jgi:SAM-dependent methyltransferase